MKLCKRISAILLALMLLCSLAMPAFADTGVTITINNAINGATYTGYAILDASVSLKDTCAHGSAAGAVHESSCYNVAYQSNGTFRPELLAALKLDSGSGDDQIRQALEAMKDNDPAVRAFTLSLYTRLEENSKLTADNGTSSAPAENNTAKLEVPKAGYWLIVENLPEGDTKSVRSVLMLDTAGIRDISIHTKRANPTLLKRVQDNESYRAGADVEIGEKVTFSIVTSIPDLYGYKVYTYKIHDTMAAGFQFDQNSLKVHIDNPQGLDLNQVIQNTDGTYKQYYTCVPGTDNTFTVTVDIKQAIEDGAVTTLNRLHTIYSCTLTEAANVYDPSAYNSANDKYEHANKNTAYLEFSNDPLNTQKTTKTTDSTAYVWTFPLYLNKIDSVDKSRLDGAKFVVVRKPDSITTQTDVSKFKVNLNDNGDLQITDSDGKTLTEEEMKSYMLAFTETPGSESNGYVNTYKMKSGVISTDDDYIITAGKAIIQGLDDRTDYYLFEVKAPDGYNLLTAPVAFRYYAEYHDTGLFRTEDGYPYANIGSGRLDTTMTGTVENNSGTELPSTGGIGTTIFYALGGVMVLGAVVLLITKKRMGEV